jgi:FMN phosphatase YigB (HAD superfamily)
VISPIDRPGADPATEALVARFLRSFNHLRGQPIALYGLGPNTQHLLERLEGFQIVGLMDPENIGRRVFSLPVLSHDEAAARVKAIVIVARTAVIPIILARIADLSARGGIDIYDVGGNLLTGPSHSARQPWQARPGCGEEALRRAIGRADVLSFDLFDTLLMRQVARPENLFDLVEVRTRGWLGPERPFKRERMAAERAASKQVCAPSIEGIYAVLAARLGLNAKDAAHLMAEEIAVETEGLVRREAMVRIFDESVASGQPVYLVSDMYLGKAILAKILAKTGISGYRELIVSCDLGKTKRSGELFAYLRERAGAGEILHIGDDPVADGEAPQRLGLQAFPICSGYEMLLASPFAGVLASVASPADALALGLVIACIFNNPFLFHQTQGRIRIETGRNLGFLGYGALVVALLQWLAGQTKGRRCATILFGARDGYLFHRLYQRMVNNLDMHDAARGVYFLTSRRAVTVPSVHCREQILALLESAAGQPSFAEFLETRFGVTPSPTDPRAGQRFDREEIGELRSFVLDYEEAILAQAAAEREAYRLYVASLQLPSEGELFFFDLITSGTLPYFLPQVLGREPVCLCVLMNHPPKFALRAGFLSFLGLAEAFDRSHHFLRGHYLAESIFTAPDPELRRFDAQGKPVFADHEDSHSLYAKTEPVREGIFAYVDAFLSLAGRAPLEPITPELADGILGMILSQECEIDEELKAVFRVGDHYTFLPALNPWTTILPQPNAEMPALFSLPSQSQ